MARTLIATAAFLTLVAGPAWAQTAEVFDFDAEVQKGEQRPGLTLEQMVRTANYTAGAIVMRPGMVIHIPKGVPHALRAEGGTVTILDFAQPPFDPAHMEWIK